MTNYIWIRITKSGGSSLNSIFSNFNNITYLTPTYYNHDKFININIKDKIIIANIRNPFEKIYSAYNFLRNNSNDRCDKVINKNITFYDFLLKVKNLRKDCKLYNLELFNGIYCTKKKLIYREIDYQVYWVLSHVESNKDSIEFFTNIQNVKLIKLENINNDIKSIFPGIKVPKLNASSGKSANYETLDSKTKELFNNMYKDDIEFYKSLL